MLLQDLTRPNIYWPLEVYIIPFDSVNLTSTTTIPLFFYIHCQTNDVEINIFVFLVNTPPRSCYHLILRLRHLPHPHILGCCCRIGSDIGCIHVLRHPRQACITVSAAQYLNTPLYEVSSYSLFVNKFLSNLVNYNVNPLVIIDVFLVQPVFVVDIIKYDRFYRFPLGVLVNTVNLSLKPPQARK